MVYLQDVPETSVEERLAECLMKKNNLLCDMDGRENLQLITINDAIYRYTGLRKTYLAKGGRYEKHYDILIEDATLRLLEAYSAKISVILSSGYLKPKILFRPTNNDNRHDYELEMLLEEINIAESITREGKLYNQQGIMIAYRLMLLISLKRTEEIKKCMDDFLNFHKEYVTDIDQEMARSVVLTLVKLIQSILLTDQEIEMLFIDTFFANDWKCLQSLRADFDDIYKKYVSICGDVSKIGNPKWYNCLKYFKFKVLNNKLSDIREEKEVLRKNILIEEEKLSKMLCKHKPEIEELKTNMKCLKIIEQELANKYRITVSLV